MPSDAPWTLPRISLKTTEASAFATTQEQTDDLSFAARHAPYELLERRGFAAHPCAARRL